jgi:hypothetical protein
MLFAAIFAAGLNQHNYAQTSGRTAFSLSH